MGHPKAFSFEHQIAEGDQVQIDAARGPCGVIGGPAQGDFDFLGCFQQPGRFHRGGQGSRGVEIGGPGIFADRFRDETAADGRDVDVGMGGQPFQRRGKRVAHVTDVASQGDQALVHRRPTLTRVCCCLGPSIILVVSSGLLNGPRCDPGR